MDPIHVPPVPSQAFNKTRRISDLIRAQVKHLKHLEEKLSPELRQQIPQHPIVTEDDAARYIAPMTRLLRTSRTPIAPPASSAKPVAAKPIPIRSSQDLDIAAAAGGEISTVGSKPTTGNKPSSKSKAALAARKEKKP